MDTDYPIQRAAEVHLIHTLRGIAARACDITEETTLETDDEDERHARWVAAVDDVVTDLHPDDRHDMSPEANAAYRGLLRRIILDNAATFHRLNLVV